MIICIIYLINFLLLFFLLRFNIDFILFVEVLLIMGLYTYFLLKSRKKLIKWKYILLCFLLLIVQLVVMILLFKLDLVVMPIKIGDALESTFIFLFFYIFGLAYIILLLFTNLIKYLLEKIKVNKEDLC